MNKSVHASVFPASFTNETVVRINREEVYIYFGQSAVDDIKESCQVAEVVLTLPAAMRLMEQMNQRFREAFPEEVK